MTSEHARASRPDARIAVFETRPLFAPELQRQFIDGGITVHACTLAADLERMERPGVCVLRLDCDPEGVIAFLRHADPMTACVVVASESGAEWSLRELGAATVVDESIRGDELAAVCRKLCERMQRRVRDAT